MMIYQIIDEFTKQMKSLMYILIYVIPIKFAKIWYSMVLDNRGNGDE